MKTPKTVTVLLSIFLIVVGCGNIRAVPPCDTAWIAYPNPQICQNSPTQFPVIPGTIGGIFSGTPGLVLDSVSGAISPPNSSIGQHFVTYRTTGTCRDTATIPVQILPAPDPAFLYPGTICIADPNNPIPSVNTSGGSFRAFGSGLSFADSTTGEISLSKSQPGTYLVLHLVGNQCPDSAVQVVTILPQTPANFHYPDTIYCQSQPIAAPVVQGQGGGTFWTNTAGVILDSVSGFIDLPNSQFSWPTIFYESPGPCPDTASFWMVIAPQGNAAFTYAPTSFCTTDPNPAPIVTGDTNGIFSCAYGGAVIDPQTGQINLSASQPGDSVLIQFYAPGLTTFCPDSTTIRIRIFAPDTTISVSYPDSAFCANDPDPVPSVVGDPGGTFGAVPPGLVFASPFSGVVDISASQPGTYSVRYYPPGACSDTSGNFTLTILPPPSIGLFYPNSEACEGTGVIAPLGLLDTLGVFYRPGAMGGEDTSFALDSNLGTINTDSSAPGSYTIAYYSGGACPLDTSFSFRILSRPEPMLICSADSNTICEGEAIDLLAVGGDKFEFYYRDSLVRALSANPVFTPDFPLEDGDKFGLVALNFEGQCTARDSFELQVITPPEILNLSYPETVSSGEAFRIRLSLSRDSADLTLIRSGLNLSLDSSKTQDFYSYSSFFDVEEQVFLETTLGLGNLTLTLRPSVGGCQGDLDSLSITVLPAATSIFIPELITPNGDGRNDVWEIRTLDNVRPEDYRVSVFNRAGGRVHAQDRLTAGWSPDRLSDGVYWYVVKDVQGGEVLRGGLTIRRN